MVRVMLRVKSWAMLFKRAVNSKNISFSGPALNLYKQCFKRVIDQQDWVKALRFLFYFNIY